MRMDNLTNICEATSQSHELDNYRPTHRKGKKLLAEKKRRARINNCLMQIRDIVCEGEEEKDTDLEKMEKAEILEKTLEVLTKLRHDYSSQGSSFSTRKAMAIRYASGFSSCAEESIRYIQNSRLVPAEVKVQLQNHLRSISHRMEASLQGDNQNLNLSPSYQPSTSLISSPLSLSSDRLIGDLRDNQIGTSIEKGLLPDTGLFYTPSPIHFSTPGIQPHSLNTEVSKPHHQEQSFITFKEESFMKHNCGQQLRAAEDPTGNTLTNKSFNKETYSSDNQSLFHQLCSFSSETTKDKQFVTSFTSPDATYSLSVPSLNEATPTASSPIIFYSSPVLSNTQILSDQSLISYHVYEPYPTCTVPSILVQPITYVTTPVNQSQPSNSSVNKQPGSLNNALDLCVKRNEDHQISPETMWRPW